MQGPSVSQVALPAKSTTALGNMYDAPRNGNVKYDATRSICQALERGAAAAGSCRRHAAQRRHVGSRVAGRRGPPAPLPSHPAHVSSVSRQQHTPTTDAGRDPPAPLFDHDSPPFPTLSSHGATHLRSSVIILRLFQRCHRTERPSLLLLIADRVQCLPRASPSPQSAAVSTQAHRGAGVAAEAA
jgi:hypothetical protein